MRKRKAVQKKAYIKPIILGFVLLYVIIVVLSTYLMKIQFEKEFYLRLSDKAESMKSSFDNMEASARDQYEFYGQIDEELYFRNMMPGMVSFVENPNKYQQFSVALYDYSGEKVAQSIGYIYFYYGDGNDPLDKPEDNMYYYELTDYFSDKEISQLMQYYKERILEQTPFFARAYIQKETRELAKVQIYKGYYREDGSLAWDKTLEFEWKNPNVNTSDQIVATNYHVELDINCPGFITWGEENYERWMQDEYLQVYPEYIEGLPKAVDGKYDLYTNYWKLTESVQAETTLVLWYHEEEEDRKPYILKIRQTTHPWLAAMDYLKYVYLIGFLLAAGCIAGVIYSANKTYAQRIALEKSRRDFTNAIAHEQKTPLGIIRGFAENLKENTIEEKREYYIDQIIGQTEEMDKLVQEMISVSKLDSEDLTLKKENITIKELIEEQFMRLEVLADKKNLEIRYCMEEEFRLEGDKYYLEKAIWNLLSNAIEYNRQDGFISVYISSEKWSIENSGKAISEEDLPYVCEMFYTGNKSRNSKERHTGLGLYLAKRIFEMHHLKIVVENTSAGVKVTILK